MAGASNANHSRTHNLVPRSLGLRPNPDGCRSEERLRHTRRDCRCMASRIWELAWATSSRGRGGPDRIAWRFNCLSLSERAFVAIDVDSSRLYLRAPVLGRLVSDGNLRWHERRINGIHQHAVSMPFMITAASDDNGALAFCAAIARDRSRVCLLGKFGTEFPSDDRRRTLDRGFGAYGTGRY